MTKESQSAIRTVGSRGVRLALLSSGVVFMALLGGWAMVGIIAVFQAGHPLRSLFLAIVAILLLSLTVRVIAMNWRAMHEPAEQPLAPPDGNDQTGIWGVGGPSMREPGSTGGWQVRNFDRRYENRDD